MYEMIGRDDIDLISVVIHHNTHAKIAIECLKAGKHTVVEKPLCYILGTKGAIIDTGRNAIKGYTQELIGPSGGSFKMITLLSLL